MRRFLCLLFMIALLPWSPACAQPTGTRFVSIAFHDIVDKREDLTPDAVTTDQFVRFLDWLKGNGWTVLTLDMIHAAANGGRPLPERSILLTFDDGYRSLYTRAFPLLRPSRPLSADGWKGRPAAPSNTVRSACRAPTSSAGPKRARCRPRD